MAHDNSKSTQPKKTFAVPAPYAPWRENYIATHVLQELPKSEDNTCPFCRQITSGNDTLYYVLSRTKHCFIILNAFPYTKGHVLILPYKHTGSLIDLSSEVRTEMIELSVKSMELIKATFKCQGFNVGFNIGQFSGATVPDHLHMHMVPRYKGNLSYMHTIGSTDVICYDIEKVYQTLLPKFQQLNKTFSN
jgi:ATP adenylyltransferase